MTYNQVAAYVLTEATNEDLNSLIEAVKMRRAQLSRKNVREFLPGTAVKFRSRTGMVYQGTITKVMQKNVIVKTTVGNYKVPANMLELAVGIGG